MHVGSSSRTLHRHFSSRLYTVAPGSIVTIQCDLVPEGDFVPDSLIDTSGKFVFVLGGGNYLPGLHDLVANMSIGQTTKQSIDAGWGAHNPKLVVEVPKSQVAANIPEEQIRPGVQLYLQNGVECTITSVSEDTFMMDANPPLAGASYLATVELLKVEEPPQELEYTATAQQQSSNYKVATFALGCFWSGELDFMRMPGIVGTKVGYTQGTTANPTYEQVCQGTTGHTEAIQIIYDETVVTFEKLVHHALQRLGENKYLLNQVGNDQGTQYRHGVYYHDDAQKEIATAIIQGFGEDCVTECLPATKFWDAEDYHQQYLLKGGQSARKNDTSVIRCYG